MLLQVLALATRPRWTNTGKELRRNPCRSKSKPAEQRCRVRGAGMLGTFKTLVWVGTDDTTHLLDLLSESDFARR